MKKKICLALGVVFTVVALVAWWWRIPKPEEISRIPVVWTSATTPAIEATVDGKKCLLEFGSSGKFLLYLNENGLEFVADKTSQGTGTWRDMRGNSYESPSYAVKSLAIGNIVFSDVIAQSKNTQDEQNHIWLSPNYNENLWPKISGGIGTPLLKKTNLLLDLGHDMIIAANSESSLKKQDIFLGSMKKFPLESEERGLVLKVDTDVGPLRLEINTGATMSLVRSSLIDSKPNYTERLKKDYRGLSYFTTSLAIGATNLGPQEIYLTEMCDEMTWLDGCLGVDFLKKHLVYIDYQNNVVYISEQRAV